MDPTTYGFYELCLVARTFTLPSVSWKSKAFSDMLANANPQTRQAWYDLGADIERLAGRRPTFVETNRTGVIQVATEDPDDLARIRMLHGN